ncbi:hypothetical protein JQ634_27700 [Bradyrhizobium sp. AUGA SZCCT0240]|uniref:hypothetical protein n=1 Tax=unclassified Bradyrhizobium TaxID=2631580 RepID=UPI001BA87204|nr:MULTISPECIES: hypothetical protein [unclassified Bradyrhizobium]MBR1191351.1 hypothetical protein [Bradyrhizobium sp. AUGA SZCCT0160]MBR1196240.1 hypothetical protein [Bradyrhizobium sp. AUGA SZCCT0158]MBR1243208.1 hypothetical protein [Bradyrhizobium sp. AUGA SZCCT0274]MBR1247569.1 hypothetical protein [Bradyrhizobium sp. AUGA SZCCT0169]MBR1257461.1 hypothetical protein [Bradyrhizobium sp. AUGA SZCCT0240]
MFDWWKSKKPSTKSADRGRGGGPHVILEELRSRVPRYLDDADNGKLIYPACKRALSDLDGDISSVWDHTRLEAMRYVTMVPSPQFELLTGSDRQIEMMNAYLFQRPHDETVIDFTGTATTDFAIAIVAGLNWLTHCAQLSGVEPGKQSGTIRNFRRIVTLAHQWWLTEGAGERASRLLDNGEQPPLMFYLVWNDYTQLAKHIAAATVFGSSANRAAKLVALPADLIPRFEAAQDPLELADDAARPR